MGVSYDVVIAVGWDLEIPDDFHKTIGNSSLSSALVVRARELGVFVPCLALTRSHWGCPFIAGPSPSPSYDRLYRPMVLDVMGEARCTRTLSSTTCSLLSLTEMPRVLRLFDLNRPFYYAMYDLCHDEETWKLAQRCDEDWPEDELSDERKALLQDSRKRTIEILRARCSTRDWEDEVIPAPTPIGSAPELGSPKERPRTTRPRLVPPSAPVSCVRETPCADSERATMWGSLPEHVLLSIFETLDGISTWRAWRVCHAWAQVAGSRALQLARGFPDPAIMALPDVG